MDGPLRVLHVVVNMNRGGAETLIMNIYRHLDRSKVQFDFLTCKEGIFDSEIIKLGGVIHRVPYITDTGHRGFVNSLAQFFKENPKYKIIHSHMDKMSGLVLRVAKKYNVPIRIAHSHNTKSEGNLLAKIYKWYAGVYIKSSATHLYACSQVAADWLFKSRAKKAFILYNGIEVDKFRFSDHERTFVRNSLNIKKDTFVLGHVGRFTSQKNHLFLIDVFSEVIKVHPNIVLILVGEGPLQKKVNERIAMLHLKGKVKLLGVREDVNHLLQAFDLFVFPSLHEGLPVTLIEAQSSGLPSLIANTITQEVDLEMGLIQQLPITDKKIWMKEIIHQSKKNQTRFTPFHVVPLKNYDVRQTAKLTEENYLSIKAEV